MRTFPSNPYSVSRPTRSRKSWSGPNIIVLVPFLRPPGAQVSIPEPRPDFRSFARKKAYKWGNAHVQVGWNGWQVTRKRGVGASTGEERSVEMYWAFWDQLNELEPEIDTPLPEEQ